VSLSYENGVDEGDVIYRPEWTVSSWNTIEPTEVSRETTILNYGLAPKDNRMFDLDVNVYKSSQEQKRHLRGNTYRGAVESLGLNVKNTASLENGDLIYGLNIRNDVSYIDDLSSGGTSIQRFKEEGDVSVVVQ